jgi:glycosyltransferase involved in cell wall biosynthesis
MTARHVRRSDSSAAAARADDAVAINARAAARREIGGVERVTREMAARLPALRRDRYRVVSPPRSLAYRAGHVWEQLALPAIAREAQLIYSPANLAPLASARNVVVIHDIAPLRHPDWYSRTYAAYQRMLLPLIARRALRVITVSAFSRSELVDGLALAPEAVDVIAPGVGERFSPSAPPAPARAAHNLAGPYVLALATRIARKNLGALAPLAPALAAHGIELVAAGSGRHYMVAEAPNSIRALGYVDDAHLPGLFAGARAVVLPSLYEGFGLPCIEAMASGVPVVAADRAALPETCGDAALLVDPEDAGTLADAVLAAATDDRLRTSLIARGLARAARFPWQATVERTDALLGGLLEAR